MSDVCAVIDERQRRRCADCNSFLRTEPDEVRHELDYDYDHYEREATPVDVTILVRRCRNCGTEHADTPTHAEIQQRRY